MCSMRITVISGGTPGARFVRGLLQHLDGRGAAEVTVVANTGDDLSLWGLRVQPDVDALLAELGGPPADASRVVAGELAALDLHPQWFPVSDREVATHLARTAWLGQGATPTQVTARLAERAGLPANVRILPMSDVPVETHAVLDGPDGQQAVHVQQWRHELGSPPAVRFVVAGMDRAAAAPGVLDALRSADVVLLTPSDPVLSVGIVLGVPGVRDALRGTSAPVVGVSPDPAPLGASLAAVGIEPTSAGIAGLYQDLLAGWLAPATATPARGGRWTTRAVDLDRPAEQVAADALDLALGLRP